MFERNQGGELQQQAQQKRGDDDNQPLQREIPQVRGEGEPDLKEEPAPGTAVQKENQLQLFLVLLQQNKS